MAGFQLSTEGTTNSQPNTLTDSASLSSSTSRTREFACSERARIWVYLHRRDIIIGLAGEVVSGIDDLQRVLTEDRIGERVEAVVLRKVRRVALDVMPDESR